MYLDNVEHSLILKPTNLPDMTDYPCSKEKFLDGIRELHIGEWRTSYNIERFGYKALDGTQWELEIECSNGHKTFKSYGNNSYPYNFKDFQKLLGIDSA